ncbi:hypothetical protein Cni_G26296 [Canna indica]|uniref:Non-haem dioxygenase N-terminal domain-containing protein n=1 Tax=Canna indica TaxID=4628 RepID=A0AAQ3QQ48_9LILI|nr:hypothetical protein Cni_G26296 [Canna indica]
MNHDNGHTRRVAHGVINKSKVDSRDTDKRTMLLEDEDLVQRSPQTQWQSGPPPLVFDRVVLSRQKNIPEQFVWPEHEKSTPEANEELDVPMIGRLLSGNAAAATVARSVAKVCKQHRFQVVNHGIDEELLTEAHRCMQAFFIMPLLKKQMV